MKNILSIVFLLVFVLGCSEEKIVPLTGEIVGFVKLLDQKGNEIMDRSDVKILLREDLYTFTDEIGRFHFTNIEAGTYNLVFEKEGFGTFKRFSMGITGGNKPAIVTDVYLLELPSVEIKSLDIISDVDMNVRVVGTITETNGYYFTYYISHDPGVSQVNYESALSYTTCCMPTTDFDHYLYLNSSLFKPGEKIYVAMYARNNTDQYGTYNYYDYELGKSINPSLKRLHENIEVKLK